MILAILGSVAQSKLPFKMIDGFSLLSFELLKPLNIKLIQFISKKLYKYIMYIKIQINTLVVCVYTSYMAEHT